jgi:hypothetical protein
MDSSRSLFGIIVPSWSMGLFRLSTSKEESEMNLTTIAVDLAKDVFDVAVADRRYQIVEQHRLTRSRFERFIRGRERSLWVMEACEGAHR